MCENKTEATSNDPRIEEGITSTNFVHSRPTILEELRNRRNNLIKDIGKCNQAIERLENNKAVVYEIDNLRKDYLL